MSITPDRKKRITEVAQRRQGDLTVVLENVHDPHNIGAVLRSCDSVGVGEVHVIYSEDHLNEENLKLGARSSAGTRKWVDVHLYNSVEACIKHLKPKYQLLGAYLEDSAPSLYTLDLKQPTALVMGNEHDGITPELKAQLDGTYFIPQVGMVRSLNISVACAVSLYEAFRQRNESGRYDLKETLHSSKLVSSYLERTGDKEFGIHAIRHD
jgi:tRNA (guanosine-2'-O-)-methyltransferase